jgi:hypothetical protein
VGRIEKRLSESSTRYYWYPGEKRQWLRAVIAVGAGGVAGAVLVLLTHNSLAAVVVATSVTLALAGFGFGRRDCEALNDFSDARRASLNLTGKAVWRGLVAGAGSALAAVAIVNLGPSGWLADWILPAVPAVACAVARQIGLVWGRLGTSVSTAGPAAAPQRAD